MSNKKNTIVNNLKNAKDKSVEVAEDVQKKIVVAMDQNGDGQVDITDIIILALKTPGVYVNREKFLRKELFKNHPEEVIIKAINTTPALAGIDANEISNIADEVIRFERTAVSGISAALGAPGATAMVVTVPADIAQYYGYTLRAAQKLLYLYGFPEIDSQDVDGLQLDSQTMNELILCLGVMNGVAGANNAIKGMAKALASGVEKKLLNMALTKGALYPFVKQVMKWFGVKLTKEIFAGFFKKTIPVIGGVVGGGITYATFKPCCYRLKNVLLDTMLSNPEGHISTPAEDQFVKDIKDSVIVDVEEVEIIDIPEAEDFTEAEITSNEK